MRYATVSELADLLDVHVATVSSWTNRGEEFPEPAGYVDNGSRILRAYDVIEVTEWLTARDLGVVENQRAIMQKAEDVLLRHERRIGEYRAIQERAAAKSANNSRKLIKVA